MLEQSREADNENEIILINTQKSSNITEIGTEFAKGDLLLDRGHILNAGSISLLSSFGIQEVQVIRKPKVAIYPQVVNLFLLEIHFQMAKFLIVINRYWRIY